MWKNQLPIAINFISFKDTDEEHEMHLKIDSIKIIINDRADEVIEQTFLSLFSRYQIWLEKVVKGIKFVLNCVHLLYYNCFKINPNWISPNWIKSKKASKNHINKRDNNCFPYAITVALNHEKIGSDLERKIKVELFLAKYNWKGTNYASEKDN